MKHRGTFLWRAGGVILILALVLPMSIVWAQADGPVQAAADQLASSSLQQTGVIATATGNLNLRAQPGTNSPIVGWVMSGTTVPVLGRDAGTPWLFVESGNVRGWLAGWLVIVSGDLNSVPATDQTGGSTGAGTAAPPAAPPADGSVTATARSSVNIRSGPTTSAKILGYVPAKATVPVNGRTADNRWISISYNGINGWSAGWLYTINGDLNSVPVTDPGSGSVPAASSGFELGGQVPGSIAYLDQMRSAKMNWAKYQVVWSPGMDPGATSGYINDAHSRGFKALLSVKGPLYPSNIDYNSYVGFVRGVASLGADAIEIWNEMNLDREWPAGQISPSSYVNNMLRPAYQAIKSANPNTLVVAGALSPTGVHNGVNIWSDDVYLAGMRDAGAAGYMDCLGVHYNSGATSPDVTTGHPADSGDHHYSWYYKSTYNLYANTFPKNKLCFTELGYLSPEGYGRLPSGFWWGSKTSVAQQSQWLGHAVSLARSSGRVRMIIIFNVGFMHWSDDPQAGYSIIRPGGVCPACSSLAAAMP
ncbi:MAG: SH3 domain-containing protein [Anaerolineae bacterium]|nr:SH3 domain-containing protein [Anaerolineae bacterium]